MNERGREVLVKAALGGQRQAFGGLVDGDKLCAFEVLFRAKGDVSMFAAFELSGDVTPCPECGWRSGDEGNLITHLNDDHRFDFLTIARKLAPSEPTAA